MGSNHKVQNAESLSDLTCVDLDRFPLHKPHSEITFQGIVSGIGQG